MTDLVSGAGLDLIAISILVFLGAGFIKGLVGLGLPTISLGLMTVFVGVEKAMVLILLPAFLTNLWQAVSGPFFKPMLARLWPFLLAAVVMLGAGTFILTRLPEGAADLLLGGLMILYAVPGLAGVVFSVPRVREVPVGIAAGLLNGVFSGLTGSYSVPGVMYLQAIGLSRDELIQAMGLLFLFSTIALAVSLGSFGLMAEEEALASLALVIPALSGVWVGQRVRRVVSEATFRKLILLAILALGLYLIPLGLWRLN
ncbi:sulfite exporter TauE/SafE family protein [Rhodobacterales bacterium]|nr:sulfite exporter TauE/SafE family protein [Rhodobacterales bacterium]